MKTPYFRLVSLNADEGIRLWPLLMYLKYEIDERGTDIFCLQEITPELLRIIRTPLESIFAFRYDRRDVGKDGGEHGNVMMLRKGRLQGTFRGHVIHPAAAETRNSLLQVANITTDAGRFTLGNVHALAHLGYDDKEDTPDRIAFHERVSATLSGEKRLGLVGDFNAKNSCKSLRRMQDSLGLHDWQRYEGFNVVRNKESVRYAEAHGWDVHLESDHSMTSGLIQVAAFETIHMEEASDHYPMSLYFTLSQSR